MTTGIFNWTPFYIRTRNKLLLGSLSLYLPFQWISDNTPITWVDFLPKARRIKSRDSFFVEPHQDFIAPLNCILSLLCIDPSSHSQEITETLEPNNNLITKCHRIEVWSVVVVVAMMIVFCLWALRLLTPSIQFSSACLPAACTIWSRIKIICCSAVFPFFSILLQCLGFHGRRSKRRQRRRLGQRRTRWSKLMMTVWPEANTAGWREAFIAGHKEEEGNPYWWCSWCMPVYTHCSVDDDCLYYFICWDQRSRRSSSNQTLHSGFVSRRSGVPWKLVFLYLSPVLPQTDLPCSTSTSSPDRYLDFAVLSLFKESTARELNGYLFWRRRTINKGEEKVKF